MNKSIVVLGGSFGGLTAALEIRRRLGKRVEITLISREDRFVFLPSLPWLVIGRRSADRLSLPLKQILAPRGINFVHAVATGVEPAKQLVSTCNEIYYYDYLLIATGPCLAWEEIPGLGPENGHSHSVCTLGNAVKSRHAWQMLLSNPGPVVLGSTQRASCFGPYYELAFELDHELRKLRMRHKVPITFLTPEPYPGHLGVDGLGRSRRFIEDEFAQRDIKIMTNRAVEGIDPKRIQLQDGDSLAFQLAMLGPPFKGVSAVAELGNSRGFIPVDNYYRHAGFSNIYAVGVAVDIAPREQSPVPIGVPKTGHMTTQMAKVAAYNIAAEIDNQQQLEADELKVICLLDMGSTAALMLAEPVLPPRQRTILRKGRWALWAKVSLERYFLWKMRYGFSNLP